MVILQINGTANIGSTGKIMRDLDGVIRENGNDSYMLCAYQGNFFPDNLYSMNPQRDNWALKCNIAISRITGVMGHRHSCATKKAINWIKDIKPDVIHLHNIHGDWINYRLLFSFLKQANIPVIWTLHDCWSFTGRCSHFELCGCDKWKYGCKDCGNRNVYPITYFFDKSKKLWKEKRELFSSLNNLTIVTPSYWLKDYVSQSFLGNYPIQVINNGIDISTFKPTDSKCNYYEGLHRKKIILGVASSWSMTKGLSDFYKLNKIIDHKTFQIVLVGLNKRQQNSLPHDIIGIERTNNQTELAELYSGADVFVNPTYQDNYPTTNLESMACGTPAITYRTGGSPESIMDPNLIVDQGNVQMIYDSILYACRIGKRRQDLRRYAEMHFDKNTKFNEYIRLYDSVINLSEK